jgi:hypothetical protein
MKRKYLRSPVTGKVLNRKGQTYFLRMSAKTLRQLAAAAGTGVAVDVPIEEVYGVYSTVRFIIQ